MRINAAEKQHILDSVSGLSLGQTRTIACPCCKNDWAEQGRPSNWRPENSMSVTKEQLGVLYHCFRATCKRGTGFIQSISAGPRITKKEFTPNEYHYDLRSLSASEEAFLEERFEFSRDTVLAAGVKYNPSRDSFVYPIRDVRGYDVGLVDRDHTGSRRPKAISYFFNDVPRLHFSFTNSQCDYRGDVLIVEDIPSAIKASRFLDSVALLGSHINDDQASHLARIYRRAIIALDNDAFEKGMRLKNKYEFYFDELLCLYLVKDIKDMSYESIERMLV